VQLIVKNSILITVVRHNNVI